MSEKPLALIERGQPERRQVGFKESDWMRVECGGYDRPSLVKRARNGTSHHRLVAEMKSVKIAEGDDAPPEIVGDAAGEG
jgi:hypothetical protein